MCACYTCVYHSSTLPPPSSHPATPSTPHPVSCDLQCVRVCPTSPERSRATSDCPVCRHVGASPCSWLSLPFTWLTLHIHMLIFYECYSKNSFFNTPLAASPSLTLTPTPHPLSCDQCTDPYDIQRTLGSDNGSACKPIANTAPCGVDSGVRNHKTHPGDISIELVCVTGMGIEIPRVNIF